jgi:[acyl-carrier-protein] S-malonyltransferase
MAVGMAVVRALEAELGSPLTNIATCTAGHSLGEYTALCAAGALSIADTARLLRARGKAMAEAGLNAPGAMAAILGLSMEQVQTIVSESSDADSRVVVANDNCPGQVVISGHTTAIERAIAAATSIGAKRALKLQVAGAFHSPYMQAAADKMAEILSTLSIQKTVIPVVANVTANFVTEPTDIKNRLVEQVTGSVRWTESTTFMSNQGIDTFIECGNGKVISGLVKRMAPTATILSIGDMSGIEPALALFK